MLLRDFTLISPDIKPGEIFKAIEMAIPTDKITEAIDSTGSREQRNRRLPTHVVVALVIAMHFWSHDSIVDVLKNLVSGLSGQWIRLAQR